MTTTTVYTENESHIIIFSDTKSPEFGICTESDRLRYLIELYRVVDYYTRNRLNATIHTLKDRFTDKLSLTNYYVPSITIRNGMVVEGDLKIPEHFAFFNKESLIKNILSGSPENNEKMMELMTEFLNIYVSLVGWFYPRFESDEDSHIALMKSVENIKKNREILNMSNEGSTWLKNNIHSFWDVDIGPQRMFFNEKTLRAVLAYRFGLNNSKPYKYTLSNGETVYCNEVFDITFKNIRTGFLVQRNKVSWFKPSWAAYIYNKYSGSEAPVIWDPSIGFSARLLAFCSLYNKGTYIGTDPAIKMCEDARVVSKQIKSLGLSKVDVSINQMGSELDNIPFENDSLDLVFTSPPYFKIEKYYDEPGQCWKDYPTIESWVEKYLTKTFSNAYNGLKKNKHMVINITPKLKSHIIDSAVSVGFKYVSNEVIKLGRDHFDRDGDRPGRNELFLVFQK
jgi:hypothetical protein